MIVRNINMGCFNLVTISFICFFYSILNFFIAIQYTTAQANYFSHICYGDNYTTNSKFQRNLNLLLPSLSTVDPSIINNGYYNNTVGRNSDIVYGSFQCRGDIPLDGCQYCVKMIVDISISDRYCLNSKRAIIWYDECTLRYSNRYYFNIMQVRPEATSISDENVSNPDQFNPTIGELMMGIAREAVTNNGSANFATGDASYENSQRIYGLVQCTADIKSSSCYKCLFGAISELPTCCDGKQGGIVLRPSCNWRYEIYPFVKSAVTISAPQLPSPAPHISPPSSTNTAKPNSNKRKSSVLANIISVPSVIIVLSAIAFCFFYFWRKKTKTKKFNYVDFKDKIRSTESLQFNFGTISAATDNFSEANKLGQGGFGSVYKGILSDSQGIAVKRLSRNSGQGEQEFKNEVTLVAKLQHRNLVQLVGFSLAGKEKLLIYEFMPNGSLDQFLFDPVKRTDLDWERRYRIIGGVARGLVYLHEQSRLKIIHRDLKASNILLDKDMNPKIADFGMARLVVLDQTQASTNRIVGTHGYMAPEYILHGRFSVKSDVFSFGVLVLEVLCGQRNSSFHKSDIAPDLLNYAWRHWNNGSAIEILHPTLKDTCSTSEATKCIHVALLCVQEKVADRPTMPTVVEMLNNSDNNKDMPSSPAFLADSNRRIESHPALYLSGIEEQGNSRNEAISEAAICSANEVSITELYSR